MNGEPRLRRDRDLCAQLVHDEAFEKRGCCIRLAIDQMAAVGGNEKEVEKDLALRREQRGENRLGAGHVLRHQSLKERRRVLALEREDGARRENAFHHGLRTGCAPGRRSFRR